MRGRRHHVEAPVVGLQRQGAYAADAVHQDELVELVLDHRGDPLDVVGHAGVGLVMGDENGGYLRVGVKDAPELVNIDGGALREIHHRHIGAEYLGDLAEAVTEGADGRAHYLLARREGVGNGGLHGTGAGRCQDEDIVLGAEHLPEDVRDPEEHVLEARPAVVHHLGRHLVQDVVGNGYWARNSQIRHWISLLRLVPRRF